MQKLKNKGCSLTFVCFVSDVRGRRLLRAGVEGPQAHPPRQHDEGVPPLASRVAPPGLNFNELL